MLGEVLSIAPEKTSLLVQLSLGLTDQQPTFLPNPVLKVRQKWEPAPQFIRDIKRTVE